MCIVPSSFVQVQSHSFHIWHVYLQSCLLDKLEFILPYQERATTLTGRKDHFNRKERPLQQEGTTLIAASFPGYIPYKPGKLGQLSHLPSFSPAVAVASSPPMLPPCSRTGYISP
ncbi:uncharacterized protein APUU_21374A [Aspergillus puulaauensis]|uniref:Uncharacterized protein n=1 Tax=Aspergillus puulaauensis TaxID=1220207 RepID=A0A7R7XGK8_9EURO|nr:uncharacterized protein APUU_21374A [Aspergillus puulaauensis]BCS20942.1 hypothetical protein APUU_21374A [Aspergillus puulaauensis]